MCCSGQLEVFVRVEVKGLNKWPSESFSPTDYDRSGQFLKAPLFLRKGPTILSHWATKFYVTKQPTYTHLVLKLQSPSESTLTTTTSTSDLGLPPYGASWATRHPLAKLGSLKSQEGQSLWGLGEWLIFLFRHEHLFWRLTRHRYTK